MTTTKITASNIRSSACLEDRDDLDAADCDIQLTVGTHSASGEVTLVVDRNGDWVGYGDCPETWVEEHLLEQLMRIARVHANDGWDLRDLLIAIEVAAADAIAATGYAA